MTYWHYVQTPLPGYPFEANTPPLASYYSPRVAPYSTRADYGFDYSTPSSPDIQYEFVSGPFSRTYSRSDLIQRLILFIARSLYTMRKQTSVAHTVTLTALQVQPVRDLPNRLSHRRSLDRPPRKTAPTPVSPPDTRPRTGTQQRIP